MADTISTSSTSQSSEQERTEAYWRLFEGLILPEILEVYWEEVWALRKNNAFAPHKIYSDVFQRMCEVSGKEANRAKTNATGEGRLVPTSVVMPARWFWELTLAIYYLLDHDVPPRKPDGWWERKLLDCVGEAGVDPSEYAQMTPVMWGWLQKVATGQVRNEFFEAPIRTVYLCRASTILEQSHNAGKLLGDPIEYLQGKRQSPEVTALLNGIWKKTKADCKKFLQKPQPLELIDIDLEDTADLE